MPPVTRSRAGTVVLALVLGVLGIGCGGAVVPPSGANTPASAGGAATAALPAPSSGAPASTGTPATSPAPGLDRPDLAAVRVATEVVTEALALPVWVTNASDGSGRLFVAEQGGRIRVSDGGRLVEQPWLDIAGRINAGGERGLLGVAFPPAFGNEEARVFVHYSNLDGDTTIASFEVASGGAGPVDATTERILLVEPQPYPNHNGGWIGFDHDGMLLIALGDGGSGGDPENRASNLESLLGKMLRIDVLGAPAGKPYAIPPDNPWADANGARGEILHYGLRNPFRASVDRDTGDLWIGDVGQSAWEEVDVAPAGSRGLDFGWRRWEGRHCYDPPQGCDPAGVTMPVAEYPHGAGCSVTGGVVYRGSAIPALRGAYLFSDYCSGTLWAIDAALASAQAPITLLEVRRNVTAIGEDESGEVYLTDHGGALLRLVAAP